MECTSVAGSRIRTPSSPCSRWAVPPKLGWPNSRQLDGGSSSPKGRHLSGGNCSPCRVQVIAPGSIPSSKFRHVSLVPSLPPEVWACVAAGLVPSQFVRLSGCMRDTIQPEERHRLWRFFCHFEGYARLWGKGSSKDDFQSTGSCEHEGRNIGGPPTHEVDWSVLFQQNAMAEVLDADHVFSWVRVGDEEIRLVNILEGLEGNSAAVGIPGSQEDEAAAEKTRTWLLAHGWYSSESLRDALLRLLVPKLDTPPVLRLRELIANRPGGLLRCARWFSGDSPASVVVEWPLEKSRTCEPWLLAPQTDEEEPPMAAGFSSFQQGPHALGRPLGWLVELTARQSLEVAELSHTRWLHVQKDKAAANVTVRELCSAISAQLPHLGFQGAKVWPASLQNPALPAEEVELGWLVQRDLRWTQSETLLLYEVRLPVGQGPCRWDEEPENLGAGHKLRGIRRLVLFQRNALRCSPRLQRSRLHGQWDSTSAAALAGVSSLLPSGGPEHAWRARSSSRDQRPRNLGVQKSEVLHSRRLLHTSSGVRQFEFHPARPEIMLVGKKDGAVAIINHETDIQTHSRQIDVHPVLGLAWFNTQPQWAVAGASHSGNIQLLRYDEGRLGEMENTMLEPFAQLSSLSMNCTDDYIMTSGFCIDVGLYDIYTGRKMKMFRGLHQNFINILRFSHLSPHLFATASFDHTCKVWDLRDPNIHADKPAHRCSTDTLNVMCCFSPDDHRLLCSGVDNALQQFDLRYQTGSKFPVPALRSDINYRRSAYMAGGNVVATVATNESILRLYDASGRSHNCLGQLDFRNMLLRERSHGGRPHSSQAGSRGRSSTQHVPTPASTFTIPGGRSTPSPSRHHEDSGLDNGPHVQYLQSLRCHPTDPLMLGALVAASEPSPESYIAAVRLWEAEDGRHQGSPQGSPRGRG